MRAASLNMALLVLLASCEKREPDFVINMRSPGGGQTASLSGYQPRGISKGHAVLSFKQGQAESGSGLATFHQIKNAKIGWISDDTFAIVADELKFDSISSDYFPDGTVNSRIRLLVCDRQKMDCSSVQWRSGFAVRQVISFPEG